MAHVGHLEHHRAGDAAQVELAGEPRPAIAQLLPAGAHEGGERVTGHVEEAFATQVAVALGMVGVEAGDVDHHLHAAALGMVGIVVEGALEVIEAPQQPAEAQMLDAKLDEGVGAGGVDLVLHRPGGG